MLIWANFWVAFATSFVSGVVQVVWNTRHAQAIHDQYLMFAPRVHLFPIWLTVMQGLLFWWFYRHGGPRARVAAGIVAFWFLIQMFVGLMQASIDVPVDRLGLALFGYWSVSHALVALWGGRGSAGLAD